MCKYSVLVVLAIVLFGAPIAQAQVNVQLGLGVGVMSPSGDFGGSTIDYYAGRQYGLSGGYDILGKLRLGLAGFHLVGEVNFASLNNDGNSEPGQGFVEVSQKILSVRVGPEYQINIPAIPLTPYLGGTIAVNSFSGETRFQGVSRVPSATYVVETASRFGAGLTVGVLISLGSSVTLDVGAGYHLMNLGGKEWVDTNPAQDRRLDSYLSLNDARDPLYRPGDADHFVSGNRAINAFQLMACVMFGL